MSGQLEKAIDDGAFKSRHMAHVVRLPRRFSHMSDRHIRAILSH